MTDIGFRRGGLAGTDNVIIQIQPARVYPPAITARVVVEMETRR